MFFVEFDPILVKDYLILSYLITLCVRWGCTWHNGHFFIVNWTETNFKEIWIEIKYYSLNASEKKTFISRRILCQNVTKAYLVIGSLVIRLLGVPTKVCDMEILVSPRLSRLTIPANSYPDRKVHEANMGPIWGRQDPGGPHVGPMNFAIWVALGKTSLRTDHLSFKHHTILAFSFSEKKNTYMKT